MEKKKKINYQLSFNERQLSISKLIKIQNMVNEVILDYITSLERNLPFSSNEIDIPYINGVYNDFLELYSLHIIERAKSLNKSG